MLLFALFILIISLLGVLCLGIFAQDPVESPKAVMELYVIDVLGIIDEDRFDRFFAGYNNVRQITPTTWYIVTMLPMSHITKRLSNDFPDLNVAVYRVDEMMSTGHISDRDWLVSCGYGQGD